MCNTFSNVKAVGEFLCRDRQRPAQSKPGAVGPILDADAEANATRSIELPA